MLRIEKSGGVQETVQGLYDGGMRPAQLISDATDIEAVKAIAMSVEAGSPVPLEIVEHGRRAAGALEAITAAQREANLCLHWDYDGACEAIQRSAALEYDEAWLDCFHIFRVLRKGGRWGIGTRRPGAAGWIETFTELTPAPQPPAQ